MIEVIGLILEAMLTLAGPVSRAVNRQRRGEWIRSSLDAFYTNDESRQSAQAELTRRLAAKGLNQRQLTEMASFASSDFGALLARAVVMVSVVVDTRESGKRRALYDQGVSALRFHLGGSNSDLEAAVPEFVDVLVERTELALGWLGKRNPQLLDAIRQTAGKERLLTTAALGRFDTRSRTQVASGQFDARELEEQLLEYGTRLSELTAYMPVHTMEATYQEPVAEAVVAPSLRSRTDPTNKLKDPSGNPLLSLLAWRKRAVVLGQPGAGKSTLIQFAVHQLAQDVANGQTMAVPFVFAARRYMAAVREEPQLGIVEYLLRSVAGERSSTFGIENEFHAQTLLYLLDSGRAVILIDGLDEILEVDDRRQVVEQLNHLTGRFPASAFVATSREAGYDEAPLHVSFEQVVVEPFDQARVRRFAEVFFPLAQRRLRTLSDDPVPDFLEQTSEIADLTSSPLLLGVLCNLYARGRSMPTNRVELYDQCAEMLFDAWDRSKGIKVASIYATHARQAVGQLALAVFRSPSEEFGERWLRSFLVDFYRREVVKDEVRAEDFARSTLELWKGRQWLMTFVGHQRGQDQYRFVHRTFLEYFAARQQVFEAASGEALWSELAHLVSERSAVSFCLLNAQFSSERSMGQGDHLIDAALAMAEENLGSDKVGDAFNILTFCMECIPGARLRPETRRKVAVQYVNLIGDLLPRVGFRRFRTSSWPTVGYAEIISARQFVGAYGKVDQDDFDEESLGVDVVRLTTGLMTFQYVEEAQRQEMIEAIAAVMTSAASPLWRARLAMFMRVVPDLEGWSSVEDATRIELRAAGERMWSEAASGFSGDMAIECDDAWLAISLLREGLVCEPALLAQLGPTALVAGGWPWPVLGRTDGTFAHTVLMAVAGLQWGYGPERTVWSLSAVEALLGEVSRMLPGVSSETVALFEQRSAAGCSRVAGAPKSNAVRGTALDLLAFVSPLDPGFAEEMSRWLD